jgi:predicted enzyme related to lactoylglutathione lyase
MAPAVRLDHCVIHVSDWERSNAFYTNVLGAELVQAGGPGGRTVSATSSSTCTAPASKRTRSPACPCRREVATSALCGRET